MGTLEGVGYLFEKTPWWVLLPMCALTLWVPCEFYVKPGLTQRPWRVPTEREIVHVRGVFEPRVGGSGAYDFSVEGQKALTLVCDPYLRTKYSSCVGGDTQFLEKHPVSLGYANLKSGWGDIRHVIMFVAADGKLFTSEAQQKSHLATVAEIEDNNKSAPPFVAMAVVGCLALLMAYGFSIKIGEGLKSRRKPLASPAGLDSQSR